MVSAGKGGMRGGRVLSRVSPPGEERIEQRDGGGAMRQPLGGRSEAGLVLDDVEFGDLFERRLGDGRLRGFPHIEYLSAAVAPTGDLGDRCCCRSPRLGL